MPLQPCRKWRLWRMMSKDFPPWKTVYNHFSNWNKRGILNYEPSVDEDALLDAGTEDVVRYDDGRVNVMSTPENYLAVKDALIAAGFEPDNAEVSL